MKRESQKREGGGVEGLGFDGPHHVCARRGARRVTVFQTFLVALVAQHANPRASALASCELAS